MPASLCIVGLEFLDPPARSAQVPGNTAQDLTCALLHLDAPRGRVAEPDSLASSGLASSALCLWPRGDSASSGQGRSLLGPRCCVQLPLHRETTAKTKPQGVVNSPCALGPPVTRSRLAGSISTRARSTRQVFKNPEPTPSLPVAVCHSPACLSEDSRHHRSRF